MLTSLSWTDLSAGNIIAIPPRVHRGDLKPLLGDGVEAADAVEVVHAVEAADEVDERVHSRTAVVRSRSCAVNVPSSTDYYK